MRVLCPLSQGWFASLTPTAHTPFRVTHGSVGDKLSSSARPPREELGLSTCSSAGASWCDLGVSVGVGGGIGLLGVLAICGGVGMVGKMNSRGQSGTAGGLISITLGMVWCLSWASGVVIWGGEAGATYVGIMWGVPIVLAVVSRYLAVYRVRNKDEQELPVAST